MDPISSSTKISEALSHPVSKQEKLAKSYSEKSIFVDIKNFFYTHFTAQGRLELREVKLYNKLAAGQAKIDQNMQKITGLKARLDVLEKRIQKNINDVDVAGQKQAVAPMNKAAKKRVIAFNKLFVQHENLEQELQAQKLAQKAVEKKFDAHRIKHYGLKIVNESLKQLQQSFDKVEIKLKSTDIKDNQEGEREVSKIVQDLDNLYYKFDPIFAKKPELRNVVDELSNRTNKINKLIKIAHASRILENYGNSLNKIVDEKQKFKDAKKQELKATSALAQQRVREFNELTAQKEQVITQLKSLRQAQELPNEEQKVTSFVLKDLESAYNNICAKVEELRKEIEQITAEGVVIESDLREQNISEIKVKELNDSINATKMKINQKENEKQKFNQELKDKSKLVDEKLTEIRNLSSEQENLKTAIEDLISQSKSLKDTEIPQFQKKLASKQWDAFQISEKLTALQKEILKINGEKEDIQYTIKNLDAVIEVFQNSIQAIIIQKENEIQKCSNDKKQELEKKSKLAQVKVGEFNKSVSQKDEMLYQLESLRKAQKLQNDEQQVVKLMLKDTELKNNKIAARLDELQKEIPQITAKAVEIDANLDKWVSAKFDPETQRLEASIKEAKDTLAQRKADFKSDAYKDFDTQSIKQFAKVQQLKAEVAKKKFAKLQQLQDEVAKINKAIKKAQNQGKKISSDTENKYQKRIAKLQDQYEAI